jgi:L-threonylcarbamoyladenylate synthase
VPDAAAVLARACWPGPLTVVVPRAARVPDAVTGGRDTVGLRVPDQPLALELLRAFGGGVAAPSANRFGRVSPTTAAAVRADLGDDVDLVLDGGECRVGVESTIVDCSSDKPAIARLGGVSRERVEELLGVTVRAHGGSAPGRSPLSRLGAPSPPTAEIEEPRWLRRGERVGVIAPPADAPWARRTRRRRYAHDLYAMLRAADARAGRRARSGATAPGRA